MLLWRVGSESLPTIDNLAQRLESDDNHCTLCKEANETSIHIFFEWSVARVAWFGTWGLRLDWLHISNSEDIINTIIDPPAQVQATNQTLYLSITKWLFNLP